MKNVLVTGASGSVGSAIVRHLSTTDTKVWKASYKDALQSDELYFDFDNLSRTTNSLNNLDVLFLLRPPHISNTEKYFEPLITACVQMKVKHIVFLAVQGAEKSSIIPHHRIEKIIVRSALPYTFIRPSYFMQNLTSTLKQDIRAKGLISLPAGKAKFLWVDVNDNRRSDSRSFIEFGQTRWQNLRHYWVSALHFSADRCYVNKFPTERNQICKSKSFTVSDYQHERGQTFRIHSRPDSATFCCKI